MAEEKNSFLFYVDWGDIFDQLPDDKAGLLIKHICDYVRDAEPESEDMIVNLAFTSIRSTLKRDLKKWEGKKGQKKSSGALGNLKRWNPDLFDKVKAMEMTIDEAVDTAKHRKTSHRDNSESQNIAKVAVSASASASATVSESDIVINRNRIQDYLYSSFTWHESIIRSLKSKHGFQISLEEIKKWIVVFCDELEAADDLYKTEHENKKHFLHWIAKQLKQNKKASESNKTKKSRNERTLEHNMEIAQKLGLSKKSVS